MILKYSQIQARNWDDLGWGLDGNWDDLGWGLAGSMASACWWTAWAAMYNKIDLSPHPND